MNRTRIIGMVLALYITLTTVFSDSVPAFAQGSESSRVIIEEEIRGLVEDYLKENQLNPDMISIAYCYTATEETWYYQENQWYYSASLYKVPLMMLLAEKTRDENTTDDTLFNGMTLSQTEEAALRYSDNDVSYAVLLHLGDPGAVRGMYRNYSSLPDDYFDWSFYGSSYFTARFMNEVMMTLYRNPDRFPGVEDNLKLAQPGHYFKMKISEDSCVIAQKYGSYHDEDENDWNHAAGIFYTPNPFVLTVMTRYGGLAETIIADLGELFYHYTLGADSRMSNDRLPTEAERTEHTKGAE